MRRMFLQVAGLALAVGLTAGCETEPYDMDPDERVYPSGNVPSGRLLTDPHRNGVSPVPGQTTGGGLRKDMRTGGAITGHDVTPLEELQEEQPVEATPPVVVPPPPPVEEDDEGQIEIEVRDD